MAGTAVNWRTTAISQNIGQFWASLAIPGAGSRITLAADGTPDATANTTAFHYGATKAGAKLMIKATFAKYSVDEFRAPIITNLDTVEMGISAELVAVTDMDVITKLLPGVGTYATTVSTFKEVRVGQKAIAYESVAVIFPTIADATKFTIFNLYSAINDVGVEFAVGRKELGFTPVSFVGYEITTRAAADTLGSYWVQI
jgi:hypothetical protein